MNPVEKQLRKQIQKLHGVIEASAVVISSLEIEDVLQLVMEIARKVVDAQASSLLILNEDTGLLEYEIALGDKGEEVKQKFTLKLGQGIAGWVAQHNEPLLVPDVQNDERFFRGSDQATGFKTRSIMCVPMRVHGRLIGVIEAINPSRQKAFNEQDLEVLNAFSGLAAIAIENARLTRRKIEQQALEQELAISRRIQENFLTREFVSRQGVEVAAMARSAHEIGGDFYDVLELDENRRGFVIGDVSGRGIPAALYMIKILSEFRIEALSRRTEGLILRRLNDRLTREIAFGMFVTLSYLVVDLATGRGCVANAGHLPVYIHRAGTRDLERVIIPGGLPLGLVRGSGFPVREIVLFRGDRIFLVTDGFIEARNPQGEEFGWDRFERILMDSDPEASPSRVVAQMFEGLDRYTGHFAIHDDVTLMVLKYTGP